MLGLARGTVELREHDEEWHRLFNLERQNILDAVGEFVVDIEHVGSTAICGIVAKPILDVMVGIRSLDDGEKCVAGLEAIGYEYKGENGVPERHFFGKGVPRTHHLHMVEITGDFWLSHLAFRDYLRQNEAAAQEYNQLKRRLARLFPDNRELYTNGKLEFVNGILDLVRTK